MMSDINQEEQYEILGTGLILSLGWTPVSVGHTRVGLVIALSNILKAFILALRESQTFSGAYAEGG